jgi:RNA polymerase sigma-70 factor (sigma-E family)
VTNVREEDAARTTGAAEAGRIGELYRAHAPDALRLAYMLTGDRPVAEDIVQDAFVKVIGRLVHLRNPDAFPAYLRVTVLNLSRSTFRRRASERRLVGATGPLTRRETTEPDLAGRDALRTALLALPERQRAALVLRYYQDMDDSEIAAALGCRPGTVRSLLSRGTQGLRAAMEGETDAG